MSLPRRRQSARDHRSPRGRRPARRRSVRARSSTARPRRSCATRWQPAAPRSRGGSRDEPGNGRAAAQATAFLHDQLVRLAYDFVDRAHDRRAARRRPRAGRARRHRARRDGAVQRPRPHVPHRQGRRPPTQERAAEAMLHLLWDLKLKVGHSVRSIAPADRARQEGHDGPHRLPRSALAVGRRASCSTRPCAASARRSSPAPPPNSSPPSSPSATQRHVRMGDSRYVVEPNVKDGKGGLRDLHTLYWIGKYVHGVERPAGPGRRRAC